MTPAPPALEPRRAVSGDGPASGNPDRRLRVMHVITHLDLGGAEAVALELIDTLRPQVDFSVFAVLRQRSLSAVGRDMAGRLAAWRVPVRFGVAGHFKTGGNLVAAFRLIRALAAVQPDVVHLHTEIPELTFALACLLSRRARSAKLLRTVHNTELWISWHAVGRWVTDRLAHGDAVAVSRSAANADAAIVTRRDRRPAAIIYNGVRRPPVAVAFVPDAPIRLLFAGRLVNQKGADLLPAILEAAWRRSRGRKVTVTIAGTGILRDEVEFGLAGQLDGWAVRMVPPIERLTERLCAFDVVLAPSRFEGFGLLVVEALLAGIPVVTTDAPGLDETIPGDYPLRAPVGDVEALGERLARVIAAPERYRGIAMACGDELAGRFSAVAMAEAYAGRYRALACPCLDSVA